MKQNEPDIGKLTRSQLTRLFAIALNEPSARQAVSSASVKGLFASRQKVRQLVDDLSTPFHALTLGPLSFERLTGTAPADVEHYSDKTLLELLLAPNISRSFLESLNTYGKILSIPDLPEATRLTGYVIELCTASELSKRFGVVTDNAHLSDAADLLQDLAKTSGIPKPLRDYATHSSRRNKG